MGVGKHVHVATLSDKIDNKIQLINRINFKDAFNQISWELKPRTHFLFFQL